MERVAFRRGATRTDTQPPQAPIERRDVLQPADRVFREAPRHGRLYKRGLGRAVHFGLMGYGLRASISSARTRTAEYETAKKSNARDPAMSLQVDLDRRGIAYLI
jgi:hypothetical protein